MKPDGETHLSLTAEAILANDAYLILAFEVNDLLTNVIFAVKDRLLFTLAFLWFCLMDKTWFRWF
jgi:hypothetical protein